MRVNTNKNKNKNKKSVAKKVTKVTKNKNTKRKLSVAAPSVGRPIKELPKFPRGRFSVNSLFEHLNKKVGFSISKITLTKRIKEALKSKQLIVKERKITSDNHRGAPTNYFVLA